jgi:hypothetical protein
MKSSSYLLLGAALLLTGCASRYDITLTNSAVMTASSKPRLNEHGFYVFKDARGETAQVHQMRVRAIEARSPWEKQQDPFSGTPVRR